MGRAKFEILKKEILQEVLCSVSFSGSVCGAPI